MVVMVCVASLALAGCGGGSDEPATKASPSAESSALTAEQEAYLKGLEKIDPGLVVNEERALRRAKDICSDVERGEFSGEQLAKRAAERLSGGNATIDAGQGAKVVELAKSNVC